MTNYKTDYKIGTWLKHIQSGQLFEITNRFPINYEGPTEYDYVLINKSTPLWNGWRWHHIEVVEQFKVLGPSARLLYYKDYNKAVKNESNEK